MTIADRLKGLTSVSPSYLAPGIGNIVTDVVTAAPNRRTENDVNVLGPRAKGGGHEREGCTNDVRDGSPPPGVGNADGEATAPGTRIDDEHRLTVGMQGHQYGADLVRDERIAEPDLS